ncbi:MAG: M48 family metalloprotease [Pseudomonadota bacterium]
MNRTLMWVLLLIFVLTGCASGRVDAVDQVGIDSESDPEYVEGLDGRLELMADQLVDSLVNEGALFEDDALADYLQSITDQLFPDFKGTLRTRAIRSTEPNAFALPNGELFINTGMLARLNNEAELAFIVGHEGAHYTESHSRRSYRSATRTNIFINVAGASGYGLGGSIVGMTAFMRHSQGLESDADAFGFSRAGDAGYDVNGLGDWFLRLNREQKVGKSPGFFFVRTHPSLTRRSKTMNQLALSVPERGAEHADRFLRITKNARMAVLKGLTEAGKPDKLIHLLETEDRLDLFPRDARFYLAEAYRTRANTGDWLVAEQLYRELADATPPYAEALSKLGVMLIERGDIAAARPYFHRYLELRPEGPDRRWAEHYLERHPTEDQ